MSTSIFQAIYDGDALRDHAIDVAHLAPAMLALGNLMREANAVLNGNRSKVKLLVKANHENHCFDITFELVQNLISQIRGLLEDEDIKTAKDLLEWLGIIGAPIGGIGLLAYLKVRRGRKIQNIFQNTDDDDRGLIKIQFEGDKNNVIVHNHVYNMGENKRIQNSVSETLDPLSADGIDTLEFRGSDEAPIKYNKADSEDIHKSCELDERQEAYVPQIVEAHLQIYSPIYDSESEHWRFDYGGDHIRVNITETNVAKDAIERGGVFVNDTYKVKLEIMEYRTPSGQYRKKYKILEVLEYIPAPQQQSLFD